MKSQRYHGNRIANYPSPGLSVHRHLVVVTCSSLWIGLDTTETNSKQTQSKSTIDICRSIKWISYTERSNTPCAVSPSWPGVASTLGEVQKVKSILCFYRNTDFKHMIYLNCSLETIGNRIATIGSRILICCILLHKSEEKSRIYETHSWYLYARRIMQERERERERAVS